VQDQQARIEGGRTCWNGVNIIYGVVEACGCVKVLTEFHTDGFQVWNDTDTSFVVGKVFATIEGHVFEKVGQTPLVFVFLHGTHLLHDVEIGLVGRQVVLSDVIGQAVVELADAHRLIHRDGGHLLLGHPREYGNEIGY